MRRFTLKQSLLFLLILFFCFFRSTVWAAEPLTSSGSMMPQAKTPAPKRTRPVFMHIAAGDLNGDGRDEVLVWDGESKELSVFSYATGQQQKLTSTVLKGTPTQMLVVDVDGDGKGELLVGESLDESNPKTKTPIDAALNMYRPLSTQGWKPEEIYRQATERPEFTSLQFVDVDGDNKPEILFAYFASKYQVDLRVARRQNDAWKVENLPQIRMGTSVSAGQIQPRKPAEIVVARPYGEEKSALGDAFILRQGERVPLPVFRGVSSVTVGRLSAKEDPIILVGDGWHMNYGKIARGRIALMRSRPDGWKYELIEDVPEQMRIVELQLIDINGDGTREILARGQRDAILGGDVRVYQRTNKGWRGATIAQDVQGCAVGRFRGRALEIICVGGGKEYETQKRIVPPINLNLAKVAWDAKLAPEVKTFEVDAKALVGKPAPPLEVAEWIGGPPLTLDQLKGKVVVIDFWATWCKPCISEFPKMKEWMEKFSSRGFVIVGMTDYSNQARNEIQAFIGKHKLPWPVAIDPTKRTGMHYGVGPIPHTVVVDRNGVVRLVHVGAGTEALKEIEAQITKLLEPEAKTN